MAVLAFERVPRVASVRASTRPVEGPRPAPSRVIDHLLAIAKSRGMQEKEVAFLLGYTERYLSKIKAGHKELQTGRIEHMPADLRRALWESLAKAEGSRIAVPDGKRRAFGRLLAAMGEAIEELDEPQLELPLRAGAPLKADVGERDQQRAAR